ncbi:protein trichome birefringence-like 36 [Tripterygium wilfordii]|uniref:Protein trichome birefringence-like 36 n=1 Tax=Tripterygium wilfordii TaxID=458696 RepID=A0A7J7C5N3_TRIWF|nr:protein trichome birefringence-like 36 [Tripterygium wilfordii]KAF5729412.1 protein trichome birefringence-like 36 [Tripterygium wilfordii]
MAKTKPQLLFFLFIFSVSLHFFHGKSSQFGSETDSWLNDDEDDEVIMVERKKNSRTCDFSTGKWVYDQSYPLYDANCPYLSSAVMCQRNGRPDNDYEKWRWKPQGCSIPRFDALKFLGKMRKKRIMLVGDSIMRNQWESLVCLVQGVVPTGRKKVTYNGPTMAFHALDFEMSIEFSWAPLLVELKKGAQNKRILHLDRIEDNARYWRGADVLVFDSAHWWTHSDQWSSWDYYMVGQSLIRTMNPMIAYQKGLNTWAKWIELNLDPRKTRVFFRSMSPRHNRENGWKCYNQKQPLTFFSHQHIPEPMVVLKEVLRRMRFPVYLQDITTMSGLRRDGHPSVYRRAMGQEEKQHPKDFSSDCSHWCLPGVPDIWNEMLSALL